MTPILTCRLRGQLLAVETPTLVKHPGVMTPTPTCRFRGQLLAVETLVPHHATKACHERDAMLPMTTYGQLPGMVAPAVVGSMAVILMLTFRLLGARR